MTQQGALKFTNVIFGVKSFFFLSSATLCEFWLAQLFLSMVSFPVPSVSEVKYGSNMLL